MRLWVVLLILFPLASSGFFDSITNFFSGGAKKLKDHFNPVSEEKAKDYLQSFGYVPPSGLSSGGGIKGAFQDAKSALKSAVRKFQEFAHLNPTGELDETTREKMAAPRCGEPDVQFITSGGSAFKWRKNDLTYSIDNWSPDLPRDQIRRAIAEAYGVWAAVTPLTFREIRSGGDIKIKFGSGNHGDPWPFDGKGGVLAHATMPENGALHFDEDENWVYMDAKKIASNSYTDFLAVAIHEGGHTLGLSHSRDETSIMAPFYQKTVDDNGNYMRPTLKSADIRDIQDIYGRGVGSVRPDGGSLPGTSDPNRGGFVDVPSSGGGNWNPTPRPTTTTTTWRPSSGSGGASSGATSCPVTVDGIAQMPDGTGYIFSGAKVYEIDARTKKIRNEFSFSQLFSGGNSLPPYVQGAVYNPINSIMLLFQGGRVWGFTYSRLRGRFQLDAEFPKKLPSDISWTPSGAFRAPNGHQVIVGPSDQFAVYDEYWNQITLQNRMDAYFPSMPSGVKGTLSPSGDFLIGTTLTRAFEYNIRTRTTHPDQRRIREFLSCA